MRTFRPAWAPVRGLRARSARGRAGPSTALALRVPRHQFAQLRDQCAILLAQRAVQRVPISHGSGLRTLGARVRDSGGRSRQLDSLRRVVHRAGRLDAAARIANQRQGISVDGDHLVCRMLGADLPEAPLIVSEKACSPVDQRSRVNATAACFSRIVRYSVSNRRSISPYVMLGATSSAGMGATPGGSGPPQKPRA